MLLPSLSPATTTTQTYTLSLHDALPIYSSSRGPENEDRRVDGGGECNRTRHRDAGRPVMAPEGVDAERIEVAQLDSSLRSEEHTSELQSHVNLVCRLLLEKKKKVQSPGG